MKTKAGILQIVLLALVGCSGPSTPIATPSPSAEPEPAAAVTTPAEPEATAVTTPADTTAIATLVSLKVPNMK